MASGIGDPVHIDIR